MSNWKDMGRRGGLSRVASFPGTDAPNKSLEPTLLSRILLGLLLPLQHFRSSLVTLRQPQGGSAPADEPKLRCASFRQPHPLGAVLSTVPLLAVGDE
jgi:hypothetical protein